MAVSVRGSAGVYVVSVWPGSFGRVSDSREKTSWPAVGWLRTFGQWERLLTSCADYQLANSGLRAFSSSTSSASSGSSAYSAEAFRRWATESFAARSQSW